jgi:hypothetical protein
MILTIHPTSKIVDLVIDQLHPSATTPARVWEGVTEDGTRVNLFVTRIVPLIEKGDPRQETFQRNLKEVEPPSATANAWPARLIL